MSGGKHHPQHYMHSSYFLLCLAFCQRCFNKVPLWNLILLYDVVGPGPSASRGQPINVNPPGSHQSAENIQQMKKRLEQEMKSDKYKSNNNKGYVFTLMPLYAIGVGVFAAYKFLKVTTCVAPGVT